MSLAKLINELDHYRLDCPEEFNKLYEINNYVKYNPVYHTVAKRVDVLEQINEASTVVSRFKVFSYEGQYFLCDWKGTTDNEVFRPYMEEVALCAPFYLPSYECQRVLEIGSGCGLYGIRAASLTGAQVVSRDVNPRAILFAQRNAEINGCHSAIRHEVGDLFNGLPGDYRADLIIAGLPYRPVPPHSGAKTYCAGGDVGLDLFSAALREAHCWLSDRGEIRAYLMSLGDERHALFDKVLLDTLSGDRRWEVDIRYAYASPCRFDEWIAAHGEDSEQIQDWLMALSRRGLTHMHYILIKARAFDDGSPGIAVTRSIAEHPYDIPWRGQRRY